MRSVSVALALLSLSGALCLFSCKDGAPASPPAATGNVPAIAGTTGAGSRIAYVDLDSLEANYELLKTKREEFKKRQQQMESELQRSYQQLQSDANEVSRKAQINSLTQTELETAQKRLNQMGQSLTARKESLTEELVKEQEAFNKDLKERMDVFLADYNKTHNYDYIFSYSSAGSQLLYVNKALNITNDVVAGMNASAKNQEQNKNK